MTVEGTVEDTGTDADVPEDQQLDTDGGEGSHAGGPDEDLTDVYANPGEVVPDGELA